MYQLVMEFYYGTSRGIAIILTEGLTIDDCYDMLYLMAPYITDAAGLYCETMA